MDLWQPGQAEKLWKQIEQHWAHADRPVGQRFLGSTCISRQVTEQVLDIVGNNLYRMESLTFTQLKEQFWHDSQQNWVKLIAFALSEYAYYDEGNNGFWQGVCSRLSIPHRQGVVKALQETLWCGINLLGLVKTRKRNKYVSTLWLQSGIPQQNLEHFAQLLLEISTEYDPWTLSHADPEDLSQVMYDLCLERHPQWGKLLNFLSSSCAEYDQVAEPISGQLLQGVAVVAQELEQRGFSPEVLKDSNKREELLKDYYLPNNFFLRDWNNLIQVLKPQSLPYTRRLKVISRRKKPLSLVLDVADSMNIQLLLPAQVLWRSPWNHLRGTYCQIAEQGWEATIGDLGALEIPALTQEVKQCEQWVWHLRSHTGASLENWHCEGVTKDFLIFDAWTGERLAPQELKGTSEIIYFVPQGTRWEFSNGIEILDSFVPCSLSGWQGQHLQRTAKQATLTVHSPYQPPTLIQWHGTHTEQPELRGLRLKDKKNIYVEVPVFWHPPLPLNKSLNLLIEDLSRQVKLTQSGEKITLTASSNWRSLPLAQWINQPGSYIVRLWNATDSWSEQFEVRSSFEVAQSPGIPQLVIERSQSVVGNLPIQCSMPAAFWLEEITIRGLWVLEEIVFFIRNKDEFQIYIRQADSSGCLTINLAVLRDALSESDWYALDYQRQGETHRLLAISSHTQTISWTWAEQAIHLSGLSTNQTYSLSFWSLLLPHKQPTQQEVLLKVGQNAITVPLHLPGGLYHLQLDNSYGFKHNLGWWCNIQRQTNCISLLANEVDHDLLKYCKNLLNNHSLEDFITEVKKLNLDLDHQQLEQAINSFQDTTNYLPEWLNKLLLTQKLKTLATPPPNIPPPPAQSLVYLVELQSNTRIMRKAFSDRFASELKKTRLEQSIRPLRDAILTDLIRVELSNQEYLPKLEEIVQSIESRISTSIKLTEWRR